VVVVLLVVVRVFAIGDVDVVAVAVFAFAFAFVTLVFLSSESASGYAPYADFRGAFFVTVAVAVAGAFLPRVVFTGSSVSESSEGLLAADLGLFFGGVVGTGAGAGESISNDTIFFALDALFLGGVSVWVDISDFGVVLRVYALGVDDAFEPFPLSFDTVSQRLVRNV
jgi:hypothetical protein